MALSCIESKSYKQIYASWIWQVVWLSQLLCEILTSSKTSLNDPVQAHVWLSNSRFVFKVQRLCCKCHFINMKQWTRCLPPFCDTKYNTFAIINYHLDSNRFLAMILSKRICSSISTTKTRLISPDAAVNLLKPVFI